MSKRFFVGLFLLALANTAMGEEPDRLANLGATFRTGDTQAIRAKVVEALEAYQKENNTQQVALCHLLLGSIDLTLDREESGLEALDTSVKEFEGTGDHFAAILALMSLGVFQKQQLQFDASIVTLEHSLAVLEKASMPGERFSFEGLKSFGSFFSNDINKLMPLMPDSEIVKPMMITMFGIMVRMELGSALVEANQLPRAEAELNRAREVAAVFGPMFDSSLQTYFGDLRRRQWRLDEARTHYRQALRGTRFMPPFAHQGGFIEVEILDRLADVEILCGRVDDAMAWNNQAIALIAASKNPQRDAAILNARGSLLLRAGRLDEAEGAFEDSLAIATDAGDGYRRGAVLSDLGQLNMVRGRYGTAVQQLEQAIKLLAETKNRAAESEAWLKLSEIDTTIGARDSAKLAIEKARELAVKSKFRTSQASVEMIDAARRFMNGEIGADELHAAVRRPFELPETSDVMPPNAADFLESVFSLRVTNPNALRIDDAGNTLGLSVLVAMLEGKLLADKGDLAAARMVLQKGLSMNPSRDLRAGFHALIGATWVRQGDMAKATESFSDAAKSLEMAVDDMRVEEMLSDYLGTGRGFYYVLLVESLARQGRFADAFDQSERARSRAFLQLLGNTRLEPRRGADVQLAREAETLRTQVAAWERQLPSASEPDARKMRSDLREARVRYGALLTRIKTSSSEYASLVSVKPLNLEEIRGALPPDTTLVSYFVTPWNVHAWVVDRTTLQHVAMPADAKALARAACWPGQVDARGVVVEDDQRCGGYANPEEVYDLLFARVRPLIANRKVLIVPHGPLHYIPFAALRDPKSGRYLIEDFTITYAPSASALRFLHEKESPVDGGALVLGNPKGWAGRDLPNATVEATRVADAFGTRPLLAADAMESRLYELNGKVDLIHLAAHGSYDEDNPLFSRIVLAPGDGRDGNLEVHEILTELDLTGVNLVVLAACDSALGKRNSGDDVVGLTRALLYAGSPGVISTLWRINDEATAALMDEFYRHLLAGDSAADALRAAQLSMLHGDAFSDPRQWAAFVLSGNPEGRWSPRAASSGSGR